MNQIDYAIIAAGEGSRLKDEGLTCPKPLVRLNGVPLLQRLIELFAANHAASVSIIINEEMEEVQRFVASLRLAVPLHVVVRSTPSSMHSFHELAPYLTGEKFCLTTVDTVFDEKQFARFIEAFVADDTYDGHMAVTEYIDDEKPLYVAVEANQRITGFYDTNEHNTQFISAGIYALSSRTLAVLSDCIANGRSRMRNFQRQLIAQGFNLKAHCIGKVIDIDHIVDLSKAHALLGKPYQMAAVRRDTVFSPNHIDNDEAVMAAVIARLRSVGVELSEYSETEFKPSIERFHTVVHAGRSDQFLRKLDHFEQMGGRAINSVGSLRNSRRVAFTGLMLENELPHPQSWLVDTSNRLNIEGNGFWIKNAADYTRFADDVVFVENEKRLNDELFRFRVRGIEKVVVSRHQPGDLVKFYCLADGSFFHWCYPQKRGHSKFGHEASNGEVSHHPFDENHLRELAIRSAEVLGLEVFGGDAIVSSDGTIMLIDINDFPSFKPCRDEVEGAIARYILSKTIEHDNRK